MASSRDDVRRFPEDVQAAIGYALYLAQCGGRTQHSRPLKGFGGASVVEILDDYDGDTYRAVYTVKFAGVVYVLHAFQKKSTKGISTPRHDLDLIRSRLAMAERDYREFVNERGDEAR